MSKKAARESPAEEVTRLRGALSESERGSLLLVDSIPGLVGWEWHGDPANIAGLEILGSAPTQSAPGKPNGGTYTTTVYPGPKGNFVFNASTCWWGDGLSEPPGYVRPAVYTNPKGPDQRVQQITANILNRMRAGVS